MLDLMARLKSEAEVGGELKDMPCPLCGKPRSQRSEYIRCQSCGVNWLNGEDVNRNPRIERYGKMVDELRVARPKSSQAEAGR